MNDDLISFWAYIQHKPDKDFQKEHTHVFVEPDKSLDTKSFNDKFQEIIPGEALPRKCLNWIPSKFDDWYLYSIHDPNYLRIKGMSRNYNYSISDVWVSDVDEFNYKISMIDYGSICSLNDIIDSACSQMSLAQALKEGIIPPGQWNKYVQLFKAIKYDSRPIDPMEALNNKYKKE